MGNKNKMKSNENDNSNKQVYLETDVYNDSDGDDNLFKEKKSKLPDESGTISIADYIKNQMLLIKRKTGIDGIYILTAFSIIFLMVYNGIFEKVLTNLVGTIYPLVKSIECLESNNSESEKRFWLTYWIVFIIFSILDVVGIMRIIPFYFIIKLIFLLWCYMPNTLGAKTIYKFYLKIFLEKIEINVDNAAKELKEDINKLMKKDNK